MPTWTTSGIAGIVRATVVSVVALGVFGVWPGSAEEIGNMIAFKGGFMRLDSDRSNALFTDARNPLGAGLNNSQNGWYVGAWLDLALSKNAWGMMNGTWAVGEIGLQFNRISSKVVTNTGNIGVGTTPPAGLQVTSVSPSLQQLTMITIDIAPKLKFREGSAFRPRHRPVEQHRGSYLETATGEYAMLLRAACSPLERNSDIGSHLEITIGGVRHVGR